MQNAMKILEEIIKETNSIIFKRFKNNNIKMMIQGQKTKNLITYSNDSIARYDFKSYKT